MPVEARSWQQSLQLGSWQADWARMPYLVQRGAATELAIRELASRLGTGALNLACITVTVPKLARRAGQLLNGDNTDEGNAVFKVLHL